MQFEGGGGIVRPPIQYTYKRRGRKGKSQENESGREEAPISVRRGGDHKM